MGEAKGLVRVGKKKKGKEKEVTFGERREASKSDEKQTKKQRKGKRKKKESKEGVLSFGFSFVLRKKGFVLCNP